MIRVRTLRTIAVPSVLFLAALFLIFAVSTRAQQTVPPPPPPPATAGDAQAQNPEQTPAKPATPQATTPPITSTTGLVHLVATVMDRRHEFVTDLEQSDFKVLEDGTPQEIRYFGRDTDLPLRIGILLDTSNSIRPRLEFEKEAANDFLQHVIRRNKDQAFLMTFDNEPEVIQDFTGDLSLLTDAIRKQRAGGGTALDDAIYRAAEKLSNPPLPKGPNPEVRRVLVVISDGGDSVGGKRYEEAVEEAQRAGAIVYSIIIVPIAADAGRNTGGEHALIQLAEDTGGKYYTVIDPKDLEPAFSHISDDLRTQYLLGYYAPEQGSGGFRRIKVKLTDAALEEKYNLRYRTGYFSDSK